MRGRLAALGLIIAALALAGCGPGPGPVPGSPGPSSPGSATASPSMSSVPSPATGSSRSPSMSASGSAASVPIDPSLLDHFPATVDGLTLLPSPESDAAAAADPVVVENGEAVVTAIAVDPTTDEFVYATAVRLRDGVYGEALFRQWRDTFDEGACEQAGGVIGHAEAELGGRSVFIGSCAGGLHTYHTWLAGARLLVSLSAIGERRLGEQLIEGLRE